MKKGSIRYWKIATSSLLCLIYLVFNVHAISIGSAPGVYDLGLVDPGDKIVFRYYLITTSTSDLLVNAGYIAAHRGMYFNEKKNPYVFIPSQASEESIADWVTIVKNPVLVSPATKKTIYLPGGGVVRANGYVDIRLQVPDDAEPGFHVGAVNLNPILSGAGRGTGVSTLAVTRPVFVFQVSGEAVRMGEIVNIIGERTGESNARINVMFKNTGMETMSVKLSYLKIFDKVGNVIANLDSGLTYSKPGEVKVLPVDWNDERVKPGVYRMEAKVSYTTGYATHVLDVKIPDKITILPSKGKAKKLAGEFPSCSLLFYGILFLLIPLALAYFLLSGYNNLPYILALLVFLLVVLVLWYVLQCTAILNMLDILLFLIIIALIIYLIWG
ncbi:MAG: hypothetical protein B6U72_00385 [Candidatus Altiarchaeales archaeon ex4484_2]|nr:MAG: hypothetical protein B6U72_00385 [Candidatus Altiarchaeales archaeon ex4484_2]